MTHLQERILLLGFELVRTEETKTALSLVGGETLLRALEQSEDILNDDGLEVDLLLVVEVFGLELDLCVGKKRSVRDPIRNGTV